jgi:hypothetical protein
MKKMARRQRNQMKNESMKSRKAGIRTRMEEQL